MIEKHPTHKGIKEDITNQELAIMLTNSFNVVFDEFRSIRSDIGELKADVSGLKQDVAALKMDVSQLKTDMQVVQKDIKSLTQKTNLMSESMVTKYEFQSLVLRVGKIDETLSV